MEIVSSNCRLCLTTTVDLINIFQESSSSQNISSILAQHFWFEVKESDTFSKNICPTCWSKVENFHLFYVHVYSVHNEFYSKVKIEMVNEMTQNQIETDTFEMIPNEDQVDTASDSEQSLKEYNECDDTTADEAFIPDTVDNNVKQKRTKVRYKIETKDVDDIENENRQIREYFKMKCEICSMEFDTFQMVQSHYRKEHYLRGYLRCCNRKYTKRSLLVEHIQRHINPNAFRCEICNKLYNDKRGLEGHMERLHMSGDQRAFKCSDCPKKFTKKFSLVRHAYIHKNEEKKFICDDCNKPFGTKTLLQAHKKNIHEGACIHICDICAKVFRSKLVFEQHRETIHEKKNHPKIQCQICGVWLKDKYYLKQHMDRHEESKVYCNICGNQYLNRKTLRNHVRSVHTDKVHECSMCEKTFKKSISLKEHMATHTGIILYTCPYCPKTFNSSGNMYSHKKKHPKEWEEHDRLKASGAI